MPAERPIDLLSALQALAIDTDLDAAEITRAVEQAVTGTYRRLVEDDPSIFAKVDLGRGRWDVYRRTEEGE